MEIIEKEKICNYGNYTPTDRQIKDIPWYSN